MAGGGAVPGLILDDQRYQPADQESVLDCLLRHGVTIPNRCRSGSCQTCMVRALEGDPGAQAQKGLKETQRAAGYFLACQCQLSEDLTLASPSATALTTAVELRERAALSDSITRLRFERPSDWTWYAGQFVNLYRDAETVRSYSVASRPQDDWIELHVQRVAGGQVSNWLVDTVEVGEPVQMAEPIGDCFYVPGRPQQPLLLVGTGSGLAPLYGILRDALAQGHQGPIHLYHGSRHLQGLYQDAALRELASRYDTFRYVPCLSGSETDHAVRRGRVHACALQDLPDLSGWRVFLCGHPAMVAETRKKAFLSGASMQDIFVDAFEYSTPVAGMTDQASGGA